MYYGPTQNIIAYFAHIGFDCPIRFNPADFFLDELSLDTRTLERERDSSNTIARVAELWADTKGSHAGYRMDIVALHDDTAAAAAAATTAASGGGAGAGSGSGDASIACSCTSCWTAMNKWGRDFAMLLWRACVDVYRNWTELGIRFFTSMFFAVLLSLVYQDLGTGQKSIQDRIGILFFISINQSFGPMTSVLATFPAERNVVAKERVG
jgi:hypothetical protein